MLHEIWRCYFKSLSATIVSDLIGSMDSVMK